MTFFKVLATLFFHFFSEQQKNRHNRTAPFCRCFKFFTLSRLTSHIETCLYESDTTESCGKVLNPVESKKYYYYRKIWCAGVFKGCKLCKWIFLKKSFDVKKRIIERKIGSVFIGRVRRRIFLFSLGPPVLKKKCFCQRVKKSTYS